MSISDLAVGSTVVPQTGTTTKGASFGAEVTYSDGTALTCRCERRMASKSRQRDGDGESRGYRLYFASDPGLHDGQRLKLTKMHEYTLPVPELLRVNGTRFQGSPDGDLQMWIVLADSDTRRGQSAANTET